MAHWAQYVIIEGKAVELFESRWGGLGIDEALRGPKRAEDNAYDSSTTTEWLSPVDCEGGYLLDFGNEEASAPAPTSAELRSVTEALSRRCRQYISNVQAYCNREKVRNPMTGEYGDPDEELMRRIEESVDISESIKDKFRGLIMQYIGALSLEQLEFEWDTNERLKRAFQLDVLGEENLAKFESMTQTQKQAPSKRLLYFGARRVKPQSWSDWEIREVGGLDDFRAYLVERGLSPNTQPRGGDSASPPGAASDTPVSVEAAHRRVIERPLSRSARLDYARAIGASTALAQVIEVEVALLEAKQALLADGDPELVELRRRQRSLFGEHVTCDLDIGPEAEWEYGRGFPEGVLGMPAKLFLERGEELFGRAPILHASLDEVAPVAEELFASPLLLRLRSLDLRSNPIGDEGALWLAESPNVRNLVWLALGNTKVGQRGLDAIAKSSNLANLQWLGFGANACPDPTPQVGEEYGGAVHVTFTTAHSELKRRFGDKAWLGRPRFQHPAPVPAWLYPLEP